MQSKKTPLRQMHARNPLPVGDQLPHHNDFFSHAYLSRYLGLMLVEGEDLVVKDGHLMVRTIAGARPGMSVLVQ